VPFFCHNNGIHLFAKLFLSERRSKMRQVERQQLIELGILTPDCDPRITTSQKVSPERKRNVRRWVKEREAMSGVLLTGILERLKELKKGPASS
jgi:hypothetical protein